MIRAVTTSDISQVYQLILQLQKFAGVEVTPEGAFRRKFKEVLESPYFQIFVAEDSGVIQGTLSIWLRENLFHGGQVALIDELIIGEESRGRGIGSQLVDHAVAYCADLGCEEVEVSTEMGNQSARNFYQKHGFIEQGVLLERGF
jgi:PhnO protein